MLELEGGGATTLEEEGGKEPAELEEEGVKEPAELEEEGVKETAELEEIGLNGSPKEYELSGERTPPLERWSLRTLEEELGKSSGFTLLSEHPEKLSKAKVGIKKRIFVFFILVSIIYNTKKR